MQTVVNGSGECKNCHKVVKWSLPLEYESQNGSKNEKFLPKAIVTGGFMTSKEIGEYYSVEIRCKNCGEVNSFSQKNERNIRLKQKCDE